jgi:carboxyl-terminal processing protease
LAGDQAARQLGWSLRTLQRRLAQGRELLRIRLTRRGVTLGGALLIPALAQSAAPAAVSPLLFAATVRAAVSFAPGAGVGSAPAALAQGFLKGVAMNRLKLVTVLLLVLGAAGGAGWLVQNAVARMPLVPLVDSPRHTTRAPVLPQAETAGARQEPKADADAFARRAWTIMDLLVTRHLEPCPRAELIKAGVQGVFKAAKEDAPADLERRAAAVQTQQQFATLLREVWPTAADAPPRPKLEAALLDALLARVPGEARVVPIPEMKVAEQISGNRYVGIGIQIRIDDKEKRPQIVVAMRNGAARKAGIKANDLFLTVDGKDTKDVPLRQVVDWLRGDEGTKVTVTVRQPKGNETRTYTMTRAKVPFETLAGLKRTSEDEWDFRAAAGHPIAYVHVNSINSSTLHDLRQLERKLRTQGFKALLLDLRFATSAGMIQHAALVADGLLDGGLMWAAVGADAKDRTEFHADRECLFRDWPIAGLISGGFERTDTLVALVAAALQDNGRAVLVGSPTKADGYLNSLVQLPDGKDGLLFRTGRLVRAANGRGWPVKPDDNVPMNKKQFEKLAEWQRALEIAEGPTTEPRPDDPQFTRAVELLQEKLKK